MPTYRDIDVRSLDHESLADCRRQCSQENRTSISRYGGIVRLTSPQDIVPSHRDLAPPQSTFFHTMRTYRAISTFALPEHPLAASAVACRTHEKLLVLDDVDSFLSSVFDGATLLIELLRCLTERSVIRCLPIELLFSATSVTAKWRGPCRRGDGVDSALQTTDTAGGTTMGDDRPAAREGPERPMRPLRQRPSLRRPRWRRHTHLD